MSKVKIQGNASGSGVFTLTTPNTSTDRTITLPDASGTLAFTTDDDDKMPLAGGAFSGAVTTNSTFDGRDVAADGVLATNALPKSGGTMTGMIVGSGTSNTVGAASALRLGESNFRIMTGGESHVLCLDRDNNGGTKKIMQSWNPDNGTVAIGSAAPVAAGMLMIKPTSLTQAQIKLQGLNYSFGAEIMSQNGSESGTVGNTRCWYKLDLVTQGNVRRMYTASSQIGTDTQYFSTNNTKRLEITHDGRGLSQFTAKAWINWDNTGTLAILDSHNVSSVTDNAVGNGTVVLANNMANVNYCASVNSQKAGGAANDGCTSNTNGPNRTNGIDVHTLRLHGGSNNNGFQDVDNNFALLFGD